MHNNWNIDEIPNCILTGSFKRIGSGRPIYRVIAGAVRSWNSHNESDIIFNRMYRISGSPENVILALRNAGLSEDTIKITLENSITSANYHDSVTSIEYSKEINLCYKMIKLRNSVEVSDKAYNDIVKVIKVGELWIVKYFLQLYPRIDLRDFNNKAYHIAIESGNQDIIDTISDIIIERDWLEKEALRNQIKELDEESDLPLTLYRYCRRCL